MTAAAKVSQALLSIPFHLGKQLHDHPLDRRGVSRPVRAACMPDVPWRAEPARPVGRDDLPPALAYRSPPRAPAAAPHP